jgi:hypothetical protein
LHKREDSANEKGASDEKDESSLKHYRTGHARLLRHLD